MLTMMQRNATNAASASSSPAKSAVSDLRVPSSSSAPSGFYWTVLKLTCWVTLERELGKSEADKTYGYGSDQQHCPGRFDLARLGPAPLQKTRNGAQRLTPFRERESLLNL